MKVILCFAMMFCWAGVHAQTDSVNASLAKNYMSKTIKICDKIDGARLKNISKDEANVLYVGSDYANRSFALVFPKDVLRRFPYNPNLKMINSQFCAKGKIIMYEGKPAMYIKTDKQLDVAE